MKRDPGRPDGNQDGPSQGTDRTERLSPENASSQHDRQEQSGDEGQMSDAVWGGSFFTTLVSAHSARLDGRGRRHRLIRSRPGLSEDLPHPINTREVMGGEAEAVVSSIESSFRDARDGFADEKIVIVSFEGGENRCVHITGSGRVACWPQELSH